MKTMCLFQVYDNVGQTFITNIIPSANRLTAALGFRNSYIQEKDPAKNPYARAYKALELVEVAVCDVLDNGQFTNFKQSDWTCKGSEIIELIRDEMAARDVDDFILDEENEE